MINPENEIKNFLDTDGKLKSLPSKKSIRESAMKYLASFFEFGKKYSEKEVNDILNNSHTFRDPATLRRGLIEFGLLKRTSDGREYWKEGAE